MSIGRRFFAANAMQVDQTFLEVNDHFILLKKINTQETQHFYALCIFYLTKVGEIRFCSNVLQGAEEMFFDRRLLDAVGTAGNAGLFSVALRRGNR